MVERKEYMQKLEKLKDESVPLVSGKVNENLD